MAKTKKSRFWILKKNVKT